MTRSQPVHIELNAHGCGAVEIGGHDISANTRALRVSARVGELPIIEIDTVAAAGFTITGLAEIALGPAMRGLLSDLGWAEPDTNPTALAGGDPAAGRDDPVDDVEDRATVAGS